jgi:DNA-binding LacI/PurR family transcriptional regulator
MPDAKRIIGALFGREVVSSHSYFAGTVQGIAYELARRNCHVLFGHGLGDPNAPLDMSNMIRNALVRHLIVVGKLPPVSRVVTQFRASVFALTLVNMHPPPNGIDSIIRDAAATAYEATRHLMKLGHERIPLFRGPAWHPFAHALANGYTRALQDEQISFQERLMLAAPLIQDGGYDPMEAILKLNPRPTTSSRMMT